MYTYKHGKYQHIKADIRKSITIDDDTFQIINSIKGRNFSDKIRKMAAEYQKIKVLQNQEKVIPKK